MIAYRVTRVRNERAISELAKGTRFLEARVCGTNWRNRVERCQTWAFDYEIAAFGT